MLFSEYLNGKQIKKKKLIFFENFQNNFILRQMTSFDVIFIPTVLILFVYLLKSNT